MVILQWAFTVKSEPSGEITDPLFNIQHSIIQYSFLL